MTWKMWAMVTASTLVGAIAMPLVALLIAWWWEEREDG